MKRKLLSFILLSIFVLSSVQNISAKKKKKADPEYDQMHSESVDYINSFSDELNDEGISTIGIITGDTSRYLSVTLESSSFFPVSDNMNFVDGSAGGLLGIYYYPKNRYSIGIRGGHIHFFPSSEDLQYLDVSYILPTFTIQIFQIRNIRSNLILSSGVIHSSMELKIFTTDSEPIHQRDKSWEYTALIEIDVLYDINERMFLGIHTGYSSIPEKSGGIEMVNTGLSFGYNFFSK